MRQQEAIRAIVREEFARQTTHLRELFRKEVALGVWSAVFGSIFCIVVTCGLWELGILQFVFSVAKATILLPWAIFTWTVRVLLTLLTWIVYVFVWCWILALA